MLYMGDWQVSNLGAFQRVRRQRASAIFRLVTIAACVVATGSSSQTQQYHYRGDIRFDIRHVPFSRFGSYLAISDTSQFEKPFDRQGVYLRTMHGGGRSVCKIELLRDGKSQPFTAEATATLLTLRAQGGLIEVGFDGADRLRFRGRGLALRLTVVDGWVVAYASDRWEISDSATKSMLWAIRGEASRSPIELDGQLTTSVLFSGAAESEDFEAELDTYTTGWRPHGALRSFAAVQQSELSAYLAWLKSMPSVSPNFGHGAELAAYVNWESVVAASGNLKRPAMLMSKNWMTSIWSWDHAFNAMAASLGAPAFAWDQYMLPIDAQDRTGLFPDKWDADTVAWEFSKPPIHGWVLEWMLRNGVAVSDAQLLEIYEPLERWTDWFFKYRDSNGNGIPEYRHGDESGWDNSTVFRDGGLIESPDLSAYLVVQMDALGHIATRLGRPREARRWRERADEFFARMMRRFWNGRSFVAFDALDGKEISSRSLLLVMPLVLGGRLPTDVRQALVADIKARAAQSPFGLPSEPPDSPLYESDGYWRGPIWTPTTMILADALDQIGEHSFADTLREKFCRMAQESGLAENFDALHGQALRDPAYTWTSSVYLLFAHELISQERSNPGR